MRIKNGIYGVPLKLALFFFLALYSYCREEVGTAVSYTQSLGVCVEGGDSGSKREFEVYSGDYDSGCEESFVEGNVLIR